MQLLAPLYRRVTTCTGEDKAVHIIIDSEPTDLLDKTVCSALTQAQNLQTFDKTECNSRQRLA